jgi:hypothetical protein
LRIEGGGVYRTGAAILEGGAEKDRWQSGGGKVEVERPKK